MLYKDTWKRYRRQFKSDRVAGKLSRSASRLLYEPVLHGASLRTIIITQPLTCRGRKSNVRCPHDIIIELHSSFLPEPKWYSLHYHRVNHYLIDCPTKDPLHYEDIDGRDSWGYDEISATRGGLKHEILLHSGAMITIVFSKLSVRESQQAANSGTGAGGTRS